MSSAPNTRSSWSPRRDSRPTCARTPAKSSGIVSHEYEVVDNIDAFRFLDALIGPELHFETAGSLWGGRRVWVLGRLPEHVELGGDLSATYIYVANSHDGSMAVTAAVTPIRIVCANTLGAALHQAEQGAHAQRTFRFRHTGNLQTKFAEARHVLGMTIDYQKQFKTLADRLAREPISDLKLAANHSMITIVAALAESMHLCQAMGLDRQQFITLLDGGPLGSAYARQKLDEMRRHDYPLAFRSGLR